MDLAVSVWGPPPPWLAAELAAVDLARYPDPARAVAAAAARHGRDPAECLPLNGAAEAFWALAVGLRPRLAACVHPPFTAPEAALRAAGAEVVRVRRDPGSGFALDAAAVPDDADLVVLGRPDNPTGRLEPAATVERLCRPGRVVVVDEAFAEFLPDATGVAGRRDLPGLLAVRSLTKIWAVPGLRVGYAVGPPGVVAAMRRAVQPWPANSLALHALALLLAAEPERAARADAVAAAREGLVAGLGEVAGLRTWASPANFLLLRHQGLDLRGVLLAAGLAGRRADTFPGLDATYLRLAVHPDPAVRGRVVSVLGEAAARLPPPDGPPEPRQFANS